MRSRLLSLLLVCCACLPVAWAGNTEDSTTTLTIDPSATSGATIAAADVNDRSNDTSNWGNTHVHSLANTTSIGDGAAGNKSLCFDAADTTDSCFRFDDTANLILVDNPTPGTYSQVVTISGTAGLTANQVVIADGTSSLKATSGGTSGQVLTHQGGSLPTWTTISADVGGTNAARAQRTAGDVALTTSLATITGMSITRITAANPVQVCFVGAGANTSLGGSIRVNVDVDGALELGTTGIPVESSAASDDVNLSFCHQTAALTAASHTIVIQAAEASGEGTVLCNSATPCGMSVLEVVD